MKKEIYALGRSRGRSKKGDIIDWHLYPYVNCVHTLAGGGWPTMQVLVVEVYEHEPTDKSNECIQGH